MKFAVKYFNELSLGELYAILQLRSEVFVVEQNCVYQDIDGKDEKAIHVLGMKDDKLIAYARLFQPKDYFEEASIGRVIVKESERKFGYGHDLIRYVIETIHDLFQTRNIKISAQTYLQKFYESHGFVIDGKEYLEDGIPHIFMIKE